MKRKEGQNLICPGAKNLQGCLQHLAGFFFSDSNIPLAQRTQDIKITTTTKNIQFIYSRSWAVAAPWRSHACGTVLTMSGTVNANLTTDALKGKICFIVMVKLEHVGIDEPHHTGSVYG